MPAITKKSAPAKACVRVRSKWCESRGGGKRISKDLKLVQIDMNYRYG